MVCSCPAPVSDAVYGLRRDALVHAGTKTRLGRKVGTGRRPDEVP